MQPANPASIHRPGFKPNTFANQTTRADPVASSTFQFSNRPLDRFRDIKVCQDTLFSNTQQWQSNCGNDFFNSIRSIELDLGEPFYKKKVVRINQNYAVRDLSKLVKEIMEQTVCPENYELEDFGFFYDNKELNLNAILGDVLKSPDQQTIKIEFKFKMLKSPETIQIDEDAMRMEVWMVPKSKSGEYKTAPSYPSLCQG